MRYATSVCALAALLVLAAPLAGQRSNHRSVWSENGRTLEVQLTGEVSFADDDRSVRSISPGGRIRIEERGPGVADRAVEYRATSAGEVERSYRSGGRTRDFDAEAARWLEGVLPDVIRRTGVGAERRVARIAASGGVDAVLKEIQRIPGDGAKARYYRILVETHPLSAGELARVLRGIGAEMSSDGDRSRLLRALADTARIDRDGVREAYFAAVGAIDSDGDRQRVLAALLGRGAMSETMLLGVLASSRGIGSDGDRAMVLSRAIETQPLAGTAAPAELLASAAGIGSDGDLAHVLVRLLERHGERAEVVVGAIEAARRIGSDGDKARVLMRVPAAQLRQETTARAYLEAMRTIHSDGDRARVAMWLLESRT